MFAAATLLFPSADNWRGLSLLSHIYIFIAFYCVFMTSVESDLNLAGCLKNVLK